MRDQRKVEIKTYKKRNKRKGKRRYKNFLKNRLAMIKRLQRIRRSPRKKLHIHNISIKEVFSTEVDLEDVLKLIQQCKTMPTGNDRFVFDFSNVKDINASALALLLSLTNDLNSIGADIACSLGNNSYIREQLTHTGFLEHFTDHHGKRIVGKNKILVKGKAKTNQTEVAKETRRAMEMIFGKPMFNQPMQGALIEMMANSINHAFKRKDSKRNFFASEIVKKKFWYLSIVHNLSQQQSYFCFIDNGAGILETIRRSPYKRVTDLLDDKSVLQNAFDGKYRSSTRQEERGRGLPTIKEALEKGALRNLKVITNGCLYNFENQTVTELTNQFDGTFYLWTLDKKCTYGQIKNQ